jgi:glycosyltransferase involved in cell wall biosynthesis
MPRLLQAVRRSAPDVVDIHFHGHIYNNHPMITFVPSFLKRMNPRLRVVTHVEYPVGVRFSNLSSSTRAVRKVIARWVGPQGVDYEYGTILRDSDGIIVLSDVHRAILAEHFAGVNQKSTLIPPPPLMRMCTEQNGAGRRQGRELSGAASGEFVFAYFGYVYPVKGIETLLQAFSVVAHRRSEVRLVMIGGTDEVVLKELNRPNYVQELKELAHRLGIANKITWTGYYPSDSDLASLYLTGADACVLPFDMGVYLNNSSFVSAAAHGLPIITTKGATIESPFVDLKNVLLCPPKDSPSLAAAMEMLIDRPDLRQRLGAGALELADAWFSWESVLKRTIEVFEGR